MQFRRQTVSAFCCKILQTVQTPRVLRGGEEQRGESLGGRGVTRWLFRFPEVLRDGPLWSRQIIESTPTVVLGLTFQRNSATISFYGGRFSGHRLLPFLDEFVNAAEVPHLILSFLLQNFRLRRRRVIFGPLRNGGIPLSDTLSGIVIPWRKRMRPCLLLILNDTRPRHCSNMPLLPHVFGEFWLPQYFALILRHLTGIASLVARLDLAILRILWKLWHAPNGPYFLFIFLENLLYLTLLIIFWDLNFLKIEFFHLRRHLVLLIRNVFFWFFVVEFVSRRIDNRGQDLALIGTSVTFEPQALHPNSSLLTLLDILHLQRLRIVGLRALDLPTLLLDKYPDSPLLFQLVGFSS